jgi:membrane-associated phospholipid phosphatase
MEPNMSQTPSDPSPDTMVESTSQLSLPLRRPSTSVLLELGAVTLVVAGVSMLFIDQPLAYWMSLLPRPVRHAVNYYTELGEATWWIIGLVVGLIWALVAGRRRIAAHVGTLLLGVVVGGLAVNGLKVLFARHRPLDMLDNARYGFEFFAQGYYVNGFPSGHSAVAGALIAGFCLWLPRWRRLWLTLGLSIALTRVANTAHFLSDVVVGLYVGMLVTVLLAPVAFAIVGGKQAKPTVRNDDHMWTGIKWITGIKIGLLVALAVTAAIFWGTGHRDEVYPRNWGEVVPGLVYRCAELRPRIIERELRTHEIAFVLSLSGEVPGHDEQDAERAACQKLGIERLPIPMRGNGIPRTPDAYAEAVALIDQHAKQGKPVLVHCAAGTNRTGGVVAAYRMFAQGWTPAQAFEEMLQYDFDPTDNIELLPWMAENTAAIAEGLVERGVIEKVPDPLPIIPVSR